MKLLILVTLLSSAAFADSGDDLLKKAGKLMEKDGDLKQVEELVKKSCELKNTKGCALYGGLLMDAKKYSEAAIPLSIACNDGIAFGCLHLGNALAKLDKKPEAQIPLKKACELKNGEACFDLANLFYEIDKYEGESPKYYEQSCTFDFEIGCHNFGVYLEEVKQDEVSANKLFQKACAKKYKVSCHRLALNLEPNNPKEAKKYFKLACDYGAEDACSAPTLTGVTKTADNAELEQKCNNGSLQDCNDLLETAMKGKNGITRLEDWWNGWTKTQESYYWKVTQIVDGYVIFRFSTGSGRDYAIAVQKGSIKSVKPGISLESVTKCLKHDGNAVVKNLSGFDMKVRKFKAVKCP